ncbi:MAG: NADH-quinone oxidoreductase subunit N, partial [Anaerolineae bacterium]|nr:NADH-quinone oxidoreductase subunit N [Anaerolineae bacterium]
MAEFHVGVNLLAILPEIGLTALAIIVLALDISWPESRRRNIAFIASGGLAFLAILPVIFSPEMVSSVDAAGYGNGLLWGGMVRYDMLSQIFKVMVLIAASLTCLMAVDVKGIGRKGEFYLIVIVATLGMTLMSGAADLIMAFVALETTSIPLYILAAFKRGDDKSAESGMKYFLYGAFASGLMLYGLSLLYGFTGQTNLYSLAQFLNTETFASNPLPALGAMALVVVGFGFKISAVPFHFWTPDVYEGAPTPVTAFLSVA